MVLDVGGQSVPERATDDLRLLVGQRFRRDAFQILDFAEFLDEAQFMAIGTVALVMDGPEVFAFVIHLVAVGTA